MSKNKLSLCKCGCIPDLESARRTYGHGESPTVWYVACQCGMRTKEMPEGYEGTKIQCQNKVSAIWNGKGVADVY